jgi:energy-coupling factor transporter ATP-binding protein EcfA2
MALVARLHRDQGRTVVLVSHHLRLVRALVHEVVWGEDGCASKGRTEVLLAPERIMESFGPLRGTA